MKYTYKRGLICLLLMALIMVTSALSETQSSEEQANNKNKGQAKDGPEEEDEFVSYNSSKSIKSIMMDYKGSDFTSELFRMLMIRREIPHLMLSDI
jgi:hypothetical protein